MLDNKKSLLLTTLLIVIGYEVRAQNTASETYGLKGPVKSVLTETKKVSLGDEQLQVTQSWIQKRLTVFDREGRVIEDTYTDSTGTIFRKTSHEYSSDGTEQETSFKSDGTIAKKLTFKRKRDSAGRVIEVLVFNSDGQLQARLTRAYDSQGRFIEGINYDPDGSVANRSVATYEEDGKIKEFNVYDGSGGLIQHQVPYETTHLNNLDGTVRSRQQRGKPVEDELDIYGNWTRQKTPMTLTQMGKVEELIEIINRTIIYY
jgi:uncharacterized lipoprotein NlpE involved in copper resistance